MAGQKIIDGLKDAVAGNFDRFTVEGQTWERRHTGKPLVSDDEVRAAKRVLDQMAQMAGRDQPVPDTIVRFMLEEAAMVRVGMKAAPSL